MPSSPADASARPCHANRMVCAASNSHSPEFGFLLSGDGRLGQSRRLAGQNYPLIVGERAKGMPARPPFRRLHRNAAQPLGPQSVAARPLPRQMPEPPFRPDRIWGCLPVLGSSPERGAVRVADIARPFPLHRRTQQWIRHRPPEGHCTGREGIIRHVRFNGSVPGGRL